MRASIILRSAGRPFFYPKTVWSPAGGWHAQGTPGAVPLAAVAIVAGAAAVVFFVSAPNEVCMCRWPLWCAPLARIPFLSPLARFLSAHRSAGRFLPFALRHHKCGAHTQLRMTRRSYGLQVTVLRSAAACWPRSPGPSSLSLSLSLSLSHTSRLFPSG